MRQFDRNEYLALVKVTLAGSCLFLLYCGLSVCFLWELPDFSAGLELSSLEAGLQLLERYRDAKAALPPLGLFLLRGIDLAELLAVLNLMLGGLALLSVRPWSSVSKRCDFLFWLAAVLLVAAGYAGRRIGIGGYPRLPMSLLPVATLSAAAALLEIRVLLGNRSKRKG